MLNLFSLGKFAVAMSLTVSYNIRFACDILRCFISYQLKHVA